MPFYAAKGRLSHLKRASFTMQNPYFRCWICNLQIINTLRTFRESISNGFQCCCEYIYAGTINRTPTAANGLPKHCERIAITLRTPTKYAQNAPQDTNKHSVKYQRSPTKWGANTPWGVGDRFIAPVSLHYQIRIFTSSITCFHIIKYVYSFQRTRISTLPNTCFHIIKYTFPHHHTHISVCHFVGVYGYVDTINLPLWLLVGC